MRLRVCAYTFQRMSHASACLCAMYVCVCVCVCVSRNRMNRKCERVCVCVCVGETKRRERDAYILISLYHATSILSVYMYVLESLCVYTHYCVSRLWRVQATQPRPR